MAVEHSGNRISKVLKKGLQSYLSQQEDIQPCDWRLVVEDISLVANH